MLNPEKIALFIVLATLLCAAPGPTMLFTISQGLTKNRTRLIFGICGTVSANFIWVLFSALGVGTLIRDSYLLFTTLKYMGAAYLLYLGLTTIIKAKGDNFQFSVRTNSKLLSIYSQGFLTTMTNPKALLCYLSFLPQFVSGEISFGWETFYWGIGYICIITVVMGSYGVLANRLSHFVGNYKFQVNSKRIVGFGFIAASFSIIKN
ncbi:MAG: LysE family translocator [Ignavibacteria bacterium]|jgi:threonine/homoserine/homoserine lactone efflux protein